MRLGWKVADGYIEGLYNMRDPSAEHIEHSGQRERQAIKTSLWLLVMHGLSVDLC